MKRVAWLFTVVWGACLAAQAAEPALSGTLTIFHAGSLSVPMKALGDVFTALHPDVTVERESAGSVDCVRKITELEKPCDLLASADYRLIDRLLIPGYADWNLQFAGNEMTIVYHAGSRYAGELTAENWYDILLRDDVIYGRSDPNSDPCGYRAILTMQLAESHYQQPGLAGRLLAKNAEYIRPKETDLLGLLEANALDYIFLYRSVALQHELKTLLLPDAINLKSAALADAYRMASVSIRGRAPGETVVQYGEPMVYGLTIPRDAPHPALAEAFVAFILSEAGQAILEANGQPVLKPARVSGGNVPKALAARVGE